MCFRKFIHHDRLGWSDLELPGNRLAGLGISPPDQLPLKLLLIINWNSWNTLLIFQLIYCSGVLHSVDCANCKYSKYCIQWEIPQFGSVWEHTLGVSSHQTPPIPLPRAGPGLLVADRTTTNIFTMILLFFYFFEFKYFGSVFEFLSRKMYSSSGERVVS